MGFRQVAIGTAIVLVTSVGMGAGAMFVMYLLDFFKRPPYPKDVFNSEHFDTTAYQFVRGCLIVMVTCVCLVAACIHFI